MVIIQLFIIIPNNLLNDRQIRRFRLKNDQPSLILSTGTTGNLSHQLKSTLITTKIRIIKQAKNFCNRLITRKLRRTLEREVKKVTLGGKEIEMSVAQIMELYALSRREQAKDHLLEGGITIEGIPGKKGEKLRDPIKASVVELGQAIDLLTDEQKKIAEHLSRYASEKLGGHMNEACRKVFGYEKFGERNYWKIRVDDRTIHQKPDTADAKNATPTIRNMGMAKATTHGANNALMIGSIFNTFSNHLAEAATYAAYLEVTEDMRRIINFTFKDGDTGMRHVLDGVFGITETKGGDGTPRDKHPGIEYWNKLYEDINGGMSAKDGGSPFDRFFRNSKIGAVSLNPDVSPTASVTVMIFFCFLLIYKPPIAVASLVTAVILTPYGGDIQITKIKGIIS